MAFQDYDPRQAYRTYGVPGPPTRGEDITFLVVIAIFVIAIILT